MPSLFIHDDWKRHLSINVDTGLWQCFKSGKKGNFVGFYAEVEGVSYLKAQTDLIIKNFDFVGVEPIIEEKIPKKNSEIDPSTLTPITIESAYSEDTNVQNAWSFLFGRKLFNEDSFESEPFYLCSEGRFAGRLIIPFVKDGSVYYFQARALGDQNPKYLNPPSMSPKTL